MICVWNIRLKECFNLALYFQFEVGHEIHDSAHLWTELQVETVKNDTLAFPDSESLFKHLNSEVLYKRKMTDFEFRLKLKILGNFFRTYM